MYIHKINNKNSQNEFYLTDIVAIYNQNNVKTMCYISNSTNEFLGVNTIQELELINSNFGE